MMKSNISWSAKQIASAAEKGSINFDNAIQRNHVWDTKRQSLFIDSLLRGYPVPPMYTIRTDIDAPEGCKKGSKVFDCIDGKQRSEAVRAFARDELVLEGLDPFVDDDLNEIDLNGKTYSELDEELRHTFDTFVFTVYYFENITEDEVAEMMSRLNNGKPLTGVENARIKAKNLPAIIRLGNHALFTENMTEAAVKAYSNEDVVIKTALQIFNGQFELSTKNVKEGYENLDFTEEQVKRLEEVFDDTHNVINALKECAKKSVVRKVLKKTNLISVIYLVSVNTLRIENGMCDNAAEFLAAFFSNMTNEAVDKYNEACTNGTNHAANVIARNDALIEAYAEGEWTA